MHILGIDIGTSGVKAVLFNENWTIVGQSYREYQFNSVGAESFDLDAEIVWEKTREAILSLNHSTGRSIDAVAVSALGDVIIAEPGALIGFAGPRVIEQTIKQRLPEGFQSSEFLLEKGFVDIVCQRAKLRDTIHLLLTYLTGN